MLFLIVLVAFPFLIWGAYDKMRLSKKSAAWPTTPGVVTVSERKKVLWRTQPRVTFSYEVAGQSYTSSKVSFAAAVPAQETEPILQRYPLHQPVEVHYLPGNPAVAVLEAGPDRRVALALRVYIIWFAIIVMVNIANLVVSSWQAGQDAAPTPLHTYDDTAAADPQEGNRLLRQDAENGNAQDQVYVAVWYLTGKEGYPKDPAEGAKWLRRSADQGNAEGENMLGQLYVSGTGVDRDLTQAVSWFQKAAAQGEPHACASLGRAYEKGVGGLPQDTQAAIAWYRKAGDEPHAKAALARLNAGP
jgi:hypothetical protein